MSQILGGVLVDNANNVSTCNLICQLTSVHGCAAFDFNHMTRRCFLHGYRTACNTILRNENVTHYRRQLCPKHPNKVTKAATTRHTYPPTTTTTTTTTTKAPRTYPTMHHGYNMETLPTTASEPTRPTSPSTYQTHPTVPHTYPTAPPSTSPTMPHTYPTMPPTYPTMPPTYPGPDASPEPTPKHPIYARPMPGMQEMPDMPKAEEGYPMPMMPNMPQMPNMPDMPQRPVHVFPIHYHFPMMMMKTEATTTMKPTTMSTTQPTTTTTRPTMKTYPPPTMKTYPPPTMKTYPPPTMKTYPPPTMKTYPPPTMKTYPQPSTSHMTYPQPTTSSTMRTYPQPSTTTTMMTYSEHMPTAPAGTCGSCSQPGQYMAASNPNQFCLCDGSRLAHLMTCASGTEWCQAKLTCDFPGSCSSGAVHNGNNGQTQTTKKTKRY